MQQITSFIENLKGDRPIWAIISFLALFSFLPVYSSSSNLVYVYGEGNTFSYLLKHLSHLVIGFSFTYFIHKTNYKRLRSLSKILFVVVVMLLLFTLMQGTTIGGANASRWITIPIIGVSFQTSALAFLVLMIYVARHLAKHSKSDLSFKESFIRLWLPVSVVVLLVLPANFSTAALMFLMVLILVFVSGYSVKYLGYIFALAILVVVLFVGAAKTFPNTFPNRVDTWISRVESFFISNEVDEDGDDYQVEKAKTAIATGGLTGLGPGKSMQKNFLPQSSSDFIFAIIIEEYGLFAGFFIVFAYIMLLFRFVIKAAKAPNVFARLLILGLGITIIVGAMINMSVAVNLLPVTGQTLPLISSGGSSIWMTCISLGIILSVTNEDNHIEEKEPKKVKKHKQSDYELEQEFLGTANPMDAVKFK